MNVTRHRALAVKCGLFGLIGLVLLTLLYNTLTHGVGGPTRGYTAVFSDVSGLRVGDPVRVAGVEVGRVTDIRVDGKDARIRFSLADAQPITSTSGLVLRYQNLIGQRFLAVVPGTVAGDPLPEGSTIPIARTSPGFDLTALLNGFRPLFQVLKPSDINTLSESIVQVLQGEGGTVGNLLRHTSELTSYLADRDRLFSQVAAGLTPVLLEIAQNGSAMQGTIRDLASLTTGLARDRFTFGRSLDGLEQAVGRTSSLVTQLRPHLREDLTLLALVTRMYATHSKQYGRSFTHFGDVLADLGRSTSYRTAVNTLICNFTLDVGGAKVPVGTSQDRHSEVCR